MAFFYFIYINLMRHSGDSNWGIQRHIQLFIPIAAQQFPHQLFRHPMLILNSVTLPRTTQQSPVTTQISWPEAKVVRQDGVQLVSNGKQLPTFSYLEGFRCLRSPDTETTGEFKSRISQRNYRVSEKLLSIIHNNYLSYFQPKT